MRAVDVAEEVGLDRGVDGDDAEAADELGVVGDFLRPHHDAGAVVVEVGEEFPAHRRAGGDGGRGGEGQLAALEQLEDGVLQHLGIHLEGRDVGVLAHGGEHGVGDVADAGLDGEEGRRDGAAALAKRNPAQSVTNIRQ